MVAFVLVMSKTLKSKRVSFATMKRRSVSQRGVWVFGDRVTKNLEATQAKPQLVSPKAPTGCPSVFELLDRFEAMLGAFGFPLASEG